MNMDLGCAVPVGPAVQNAGALEAAAPAAGGGAAAATAAAGAAPGGAVTLGFTGVGLSDAVATAGFVAVDLRAMGFED